MDINLVKEYQDKMMELYSKSKSNNVKNTVNVNEQEKNVTSVSPEENLKGKLLVSVTSLRRIYPIRGANVSVYRGEINEENLIDSSATDESGKTKEFLLDAMPRIDSNEQDFQGVPYLTYSIYVKADGFSDVVFYNVPVFSGVTSIQNAIMTPKDATSQAIDSNQGNIFDL